MLINRVENIGGRMNPFLDYIHSAVHLGGTTRQSLAFGLVGYKIIPYGGCRGRKRSYLLSDV